MIKLNKLGVAVVFSLLLSLTVFTTGVFAQSADQNIDRGQISVSTRAAVLNDVAQGIAGSIQHAYGWGGGNGWGSGCGGGFDGGCGNGFGNGFDGGCGNRCGNGFDGGCGNRCGNGFGNFFRTTTRCSSTRICTTIRECSWSRWGRFCHSVRICRNITVCRRFRTSVGSGDFDNNWAVKRSLKH